MSASQAVVLCAGRGKRLGHLTQYVPKAMLPVLGRPLLSVIVENLTATGWSQIVLVVGHQAGTIKSYFEGQRNIKIVEQSDPKGTADAILRAAPLLFDRFLLTYGDVWLDRSNYRGIEIARQTDQNAWVTVNFTPEPKGAAVYLAGQQVVDIVEKPQWVTPDTCWNACGLYLLNSQIVESCRRVEPSLRGELELTGAIKDAIERGAMVNALLLRGRSVDIGCPQRYRTLCESLEETSAANVNSDVALHEDIQDGGLNSRRNL